MTETVAERVEALGRHHQELGFGWGTGDERFSSVAALDNETIDRWLGATGALAAGLDPKTRASYLLSIYTWRLGQVLGALYVSGIELPPLGPDSIASRVVNGGSEGARTLELEFRLEFAPDGKAFDREAMTASLVPLFTPLLDGLFARTKLARRAMWRLVTDGIAAGFLGYGKVTGQMEFAAAEADAILRQPGLPLGNEHWRFAEVEHTGTRELFRLRGGCCRLYRSPGHEFCTTCVLRSEEDQIERLRLFMARRG